MTTTQLLFTIAFVLAVVPAALVLAVFFVLCVTFTLVSLAVIIRHTAQFFVEGLTKLWR